MKYTKNEIQLANAVWQNHRAKDAEGNWWCVHCGKPNPELYGHHDWCITHLARDIVNKHFCPRINEACSRHNCDVCHGQRVDNENNPLNVGSSWST